MYKSKKTSLVISICFIFTMLLTACSSSSSGSAGSNDTKKSDVMAAYNKVSLGMTKEQVDKALGLAPKEETSELALKNTFNYTDSNTGYGVSVVYNSSNIVYSKTAVYNTHKDIAPLCKKSVNESQKEKISKGMSYDEVVNILGGDGVEASVTASEKSPTEIIGVIRRWANSDGSGFQIVFSKDNKVENVLYFDHD